MSANGMEEPLASSKPKTEFESIQMRIDETADESLNSTRRILALCDESKDAGIRTLVALDEQGEQLDNIEANMDTINADMREAEKALTGMEKCCGICVCPCNKNKNFKEDAGTWKESEKGKIISSQPVRVADDRNGTGPTTGAYIAKIKNDAREEEMEENMVQVSGAVNNLRNMAKDMNTEIVRQNTQIEDIAIKAESDKKRIEAAHKRTKALAEK